MSEEWGLGVGMLLVVRGWGLNIEGRYLEMAGPLSCPGKFSGRPDRWGMGNRMNGWGRGDIYECVQEKVGRSGIGAGGGGDPASSCSTLCPSLPWAARVCVCECVHTRN